MFARKTDLGGPLSPSVVFSHDDPAGSPTLTAGISVHTACLTASWAVIPIAERDRRHFGDAPPSYRVAPEREEHVEGWVAGILPMTVVLWSLRRTKGAVASQTRRIPRVLILRTVWPESGKSHAHVTPKAHARHGASLGLKCI